MNKVSVNQDITKYLPADSETRIGLTLMDEQFMTYGSARIMVSNITWQDADALVEKLEAGRGVERSSPLMIPQIITTERTPCLM